MEQNPKITLDQHSFEKQWQEELLSVITHVLVGFRFSCIYKHKDWLAVLSPWIHHKCGVVP